MTLNTSPSEAIYRACDSTRQY